jgi:hypothetical protein
VRVDRSLPALLPLLSLVFLPSLLLARALLLPALLVGALTTLLLPALLVGALTALLLPALLVAILLHREISLDVKV